MLLQRLPHKLTVSEWQQSLEWPLIELVPPAPAYDHVSNIQKSQGEDR